MNESKIKRLVTLFNQDALDILATKYGFSVDYIRKSLRGDRNGVMPDVLRKEYPELVSQLEAQVKLAKENLLKNI